MELRCAAVSRCCIQSLPNINLLLCVVRQDDEVEDESKLPVGRRWTRTSLKAFEDALISFGVGRLDNVLAQVRCWWSCSLAHRLLVVHEVPRTAQNQPHPSRVRLPPLATAETPALQLCGAPAQRYAHIGQLPA